MTAMSGYAIRLRTAQVVMDRVPERSKQILKLYDSVENIRHVCDDLALAVDTLEGFEERSDRDNRAEIEDFKEIIEKLKNELIQIVDSHDVIGP